MEKVENKIRIENFSGFIKVPMGKTPKLTINGKYQKSTVSAPLATVEATLIAACSKGVKALQLCGGVQAKAIKEQMTRSPVFTFKSTNDALNFSEWIVTQLDILGEITKTTTSFGRLIQIKPHVYATTVHVEFTYTTGDAGGQNMTTFSTQKICESIVSDIDTQRKFNIINYYIEGNICGDKKASLHHLYNTRGVEVYSWATITKDVCTKIYGVDPKGFYKLFAESHKSSIRTGMMGSNINISNIITAMFIACGQDVASVVESSWGQLTVDIDDDETLHISLYIPSLLVGTVGGGTAYETQKQCLEMVNCYGTGKKLAFAETVASFCLALEISSSMAVFSNTFSNAHKKFARL